MPTIDILGMPHGYDLTAPTAATEVLVFIHGWMLSRRYWQPVIQHLSPRYQCLTYDLRGFGESQSNQQETLEPAYCAGYSLQAFAQDLTLLLKQLNIQSAWLVGHSLGGSIALWGADQMPAQVRGVICLNAGGGIYLKEEFDRFRKAGQQLVSFRPRWLAQLPLLDLIFTRMSVDQPLDRCWGRQRLVDFVTANPTAALGSLLESTTEAEVHRLPQVVSRLQQPVYFITGDKDPIMEPQYVRHLASFHYLFEGYGANVVEIPNCGHMAMVEQPEAVATQIQQIISRYTDDL